jgi:hypothetical protein
VTIADILASVMALEKEISDTPVGAPEFAAIVTQIADIQRELERTRSVQGPLIPDASSPKTADEESAIYLERSLRSLMKAAEAKR